MLKHKTAIPQDIFGNHDDQNSLASTKDTLLKVGKEQKTERSNTKVWIKRISFFWSQLFVFLNNTNVQTFVFTALVYLTSAVVYGGPLSERTRI